VTPDLVPDDVLDDVLRERYGLVDAEVEPHDGGMNSRTWWVSLDGRRCYVAKWVADGAVGSLTAGVEAAALAATSGVETGGALEAIGGDRVLLVGGGSLVLMHCVEGHDLREDDRDDVALVGTTLARVHTATVGHDLALGLRWPWVEPDGAALAAHPDLRDAVATALADVEALRPLVTGVAHGDPAWDAFRVLGDREVALVDWAGAMVAPLLYDVASAAMYAGGLAAAEPLLSAYAAADGPASPDLEHVATMLRFRWAVQADYFARRTPGPDTSQGLDDARRALLG
jgi:hypothetical protein